MQPPCLITPASTAPKGRRLRFFTDLETQDGSLTSEKLQSIVAPSRDLHLANMTNEPLLSTEAYDEDAASINSRSDGEFVSEEESYDALQTPNPNDRQVLEDSEHQRSLLTGTNPTKRLKGLFSRDSNVAQEKQRRRGDRNVKRFKKEANGSGNVELMYEMESGYKDSSSRSSSESRVLAVERLNIKPMTKKPFGRLIAFAGTVLVIFFLLAYGSYNASKHKSSSKIFSNGTHTFGPTTILISLDGFRADFLKRDLTPTLKAFIESGVSPKHMLPSFPSLTFPNHFTLVTGLYPESHGIVSNQFWDPNLGEEFWYTNTSSSMQSKWWNAEPIWVTAEKSGIKTAIHMWPGSEAHIGGHDPMYLDKYNGSEILSVKVDRILHWLDLPQKERPQLIGAYVPNVDADGHLYGPNSTEIRKTIVEVDNMLTSLIDGLFQRNLTEIINVVIVSDHGMATTSNDRLLQLDDYIDMSLVDHIDGWPLQGLRLKDPDRDVPLLYQQLLEASKDKEFDVYTRATMPERYHFSNNERIAPLWVVPRAGWAVIQKSDFDISAAKAAGKTYRPKGLHGYDHEHPLMRAIFVARGPAFPHQPNSLVSVFQNIEVYNIVCDSLGIVPHPNNGTLRLPLKTEGLHSEGDDPIDGVLDISASGTTETPLRTSSLPTTNSAMTAPSGSTETLADSSTTGISTAPQSVQTETPSTPSNKQGPKPSDPKSSWLDFLHNKLDQVKEWAKEFVDSFKNPKSTSGKQVP